MILRPYQQEILDKQKKLAKTCKRILIVLATGGGKTEIALANIRSAIAKGYQVLYLAHREELITQPASRCGISHGIIKAGHPYTESPLQFASMQTLARRDLTVGEKFLIYIDEAHRVAGQEYRKILSRWPHAWVVGQTATPYRTDGKGLGEFFDALVEGPPPGQLIDEGYLVEPTPYLVAIPNLSGLRRRGGDYALEDLAERMDVLYGDIVPTWLAQGRDLPTICFAVSVAASQEIAARFRAAGISAEHASPENRAEVLANVRAGKTRVVCNVDLLTEGVDIPGLACLIAARPTASMGLWFQQVGRITRPGKPRAIILDHAGNTVRMGSLRNHHTFGLDGSVGGQSVRKALPQVFRRCLVCAAVWPLDVRLCCGEVLGKARTLDVKTGELVEYREERKERVATPAEKHRDLLILLREAQARAYQEGWAKHRFRKKHGHWPAPVSLNKARREV